MELINHHQILDCGHKPDELFSFQEPGFFTDPENGESCCRRCSDNRHYDRVRRRHAEIEAKAATGFHAVGQCHRSSSSSPEGRIATASLRVGPSGS